MKLTTDALIIRENNNVGESDRFVTALTRDLGVIEAAVRGARRIKNASGPATQLLCHSRLSLYKGRDRYTVDDAEPLHVFFDVRGDLVKLSLAQYFCELAKVLAPREEPAEEPLRLLLNALHYLSEGTRPAALLKAVTELRLLCGAGYAPSVSACAFCESGQGVWFSPLRGVLLCEEHRSSDAVSVSPAVLAALRHVVGAPFEKCFAFSLPEPETQAFAALSERFTLAQLNRGFSTLDFYHSLT